VHVLQLESLQADLSETMSVNSVLRNQRDTWTDVHSSLQQQLSDSHRLLHAQKEEISRLCSELADVKNSLVKLNSENDDLLRISEKTTTFSDETRISELVSELSKLKIENTDLRGQLVSSNTAASLKDHKIEDLTRKLTHLRAEVEQRFSDISAVRDNR